MSPPPPPTKAGGDCGAPCCYECAMEIALPSATMAADVLRILRVDAEVGDRVTKTLAATTVTPTAPPTTTAAAAAAESRAAAAVAGVVAVHALRVVFRAPDAKALRVSVSSFTDFLIVVLKCYQEFDDGTGTGGTGGGAATTLKSPPPPPPES